MSRPFADVLRELQGGQLYEDLGLELANVVQEVQQTHKSGKITLTLDIVPNGDTSVKIKGDMKSKTPEPSRPETIFFTNANGDLLRDDPKQSSLALQRIDEASNQ